MMTTPNQISFCLTKMIEPYPMLVTPDQDMYLIVGACDTGRTRGKGTRAAGEGAREHIGGRYSERGSRR
jgi:hypothetical protein